MLTGKTDKWTYDEVGWYPAINWTEDVVKPISRIQRKVILVPRPPIPLQPQSYRVLDLHRPTCKPYLPCFDDDNIPPYPTVGMLVYIHACSNPCRIREVDDINRTCHYEELKYVGQNSHVKIFRFRSNPTIIKDADIKVVRRLAKGTWDSQEVHLRYVEEVPKNPHVRADWDGEVDNDDDCLDPEIADAIDDLDVDDEEDEEDEPAAQVVG